MTLVWDRFRGSGSDLVVMLALADWCNDSGESLHPSIGAVARKARLSESQARRVLRSLEEHGYLSVIGNHNGGAPGQTRQYRLNVDRLLQDDMFDTGSADATRKCSPTGGANATRKRALTGCEDATPSADATPRTGAHRRVSPMTPEPSLEPSLKHLHQRGAFPMTLDWLPSDRFPIVMQRAGLPPDRLTPELLGEFVSYRSTTDDQFTQSQWEHRLLQQILARRTTNANQNGKPGGQQRSGRDEVRDAISDVDDTSWASGL